MRRKRQPGQRAQQSRLPRPVVSKDRVEATGIELRRHTAQRGETSKLLNDVVNGDDGSRSVAHRLRRGVYRTESGLQR